MTDFSSSFEFVLRFGVPCIEDMTRYDASLMTDELEDAFFGTSDDGLLEMNFDRNAVSAMTAIQSAIRDVSDVICDAELVEVAPDLVGLSEIARYLDCSRQYMAKVRSTSNGFPHPAYSGNSSLLWHLCDVLDWLRDNKSYVVDPSLMAVSRAAASINSARVARRVAEQHLNSAVQSEGVLLNSLLAPAGSLASHAWHNFEFQDNTFISAFGAIATYSKESAEVEFFSRNNNEDYDSCLAS